MKKMKYLKTKRAFTKLRQYGWIFTVTIAFVGLWVPKLGLLVVLIMLGLIITSFFRGRYWCGNICPHGSLYDVVLLRFSKNRKIPNWMKSKVFIGLFFVFFIINFSRKMIGAFSYWHNNEFLDQLGFVFVSTYLMVFVVGGILSLFITPRAWCQFCPMGTMQKASYILGNQLKVTKKTNIKITISNIEDCKKCGICARVCPFQLTPFENFTDKKQFDDINCIKCSTCVVNCPVGILSLNREH